jgi:hypothetical protein
MKYKKNYSNNKSKHSSRWKCSEFIIYARISNDIARIDFYMISNIDTSTTSFNFSDSVLLFNVHRDLIYYINKFRKEKRLCISFNNVLNILMIRYEQKHFDFEICFEIIFKLWYIKKRIKILREYIKHCS